MSDNDDKTIYHFYDGDHAQSFSKKLQDEFGYAANDISIVRDKTVRVSVTDDQRTAITVAANDLGGYSPTPPEHF